MAIDTHIQIKQLHESGELSTRSFNVCNALSIKSVSDLQRFYLKFNGFLKARCCGDKTNKELIRIAEFYAAREFEKGYQISENLNLSDSNLDIIYKSEFENLSTRAKNALLTFTGRKMPNSRFVRLHLLQEFSPTELRNIGGKTSQEIEAFLKRINQIFKNQNPELFKFEVTRTRITEITHLDKIDDVFIKAFNNGEFPILSFVSQNLKSLLNLNEVDYFIIRNHFLLLEKKYTNDELASKFKITRERIRQKRNSIIQKVDIIIRRLKPLVEFSNYASIFQNNDLILIYDDIHDEKIKSEIYDTGILFSFCLIGILFESNYYSFTVLDKIEHPDKIFIYDKYKAHKSIKGTYLIDVSIPKQEIIAMCNKVLYTISQKQDLATTILLDNIIPTVLTKEKEAVFGCIIQNEFKLEIINGAVNIPRTSKKRVFEYAKEALTSIGKPAHITEISEEIKKNNPEFESPETVLQASMRKESSIFIYFGRTSTYGLKIWENKFKNIKGGTIRDIVEEFLQGFDKPCHSSAISKHVNKYRKTDEHSIMNNLKTEQKRFVFFEDGYVGLFNKDYNSFEMLSNKYQLEEICLDSLLNNIFHK